MIKNIEILLAVRPKDSPKEASDMHGLKKWDKNRPNRPKLGQTGQKPAKTRPNATHLHLINTYSNECKGAVSPQFSWCCIQPMVITSSTIHATKLPKNPENDFFGRFPVPTTAISTLSSGLADWLQRTGNVARCSLWNLVLAGHDENAEDKEDAVYLKLDSYEKPIQDWAPRGDATPGWGGLRAVSGIALPSALPMSYPYDLSI